MSLLLWYSFFVVPLLFLVLLSVVKNRRIRSNQQIQLSECTVIIPFRNEHENLKALLHDIDRLTIPPKAIIFCNDHSEDESVRLVDEFKAKRITEISLIHNAGEGKKMAIATAVKATETDYCITWDADVRIPINYFQTNVTAADLVILPVAMNASNWIGKLASLEYMLFGALNFRLASLYILSCSGANLLFNKLFYEQVQQEILSSKQMSGDDYWLLRAAQRAKRVIFISTSTSALVYTKSVINWREYFNQRGRWIAKTSGLEDKKASLIGIILMLYFAGALFFPILFTVKHDWIGLLVVFAFRFLLEFSVFRTYMLQLKLNVQTWIFLVFILIYPLLFFGVLIYGYTIQPTWKGR